VDQRDADPREQKNRLDLQTLPRLFALRQPADAGETMIEAIDREATAVSNVLPTGGPSGQRKADAQMRSREVLLLGRRRRERKLRWLDTAATGF